MTRDEDKDLEYYAGQRFKGLEFEEQAHVRKLMRQGKLEIVNGIVVRK